MSKPQRQLTQEEIDAQAKAEHEAGLCHGAPHCGYCCDRMAEYDEQEQAQGYYLGRPAPMENADRAALTSKVA